MSHEDRMIDVRLTRVVIRDETDAHIFLTEVEGGRGFPIVIGRTEAAEIHRVLTSADPPRPMTHRLAYQAIEELGGTITGVDVIGLQDNTFYARLTVERDGDHKVLDARPSDALALGLRAGCTIRVAESILEEVRTDESGPDPLPASEEPVAEPPPTDEPGTGEDADEAADEEE